MHVAPATRTETSSTLQESNYAPSFSSRKDALRPPTTTSAPVAENPHTALETALSLRRINPLTPLRWEAWEILLSRANLTERYPSLVSSIRFGFNSGIPFILSSHTPPNHASLSDYSTEFHRIVENEFRTGRYLGPASRASIEALIGPFQTSPLSLVPKPHKPGVFRLVQNFSFPHSPSPIYSSINFAINSDDFPCTYGTFTAFSLLCWRLPPGSQGAVRDVAEAYRTIPLSPSQWAGTVVRLADDLFAVDTNAAFGVGSHGGVYGRVADAGTDIMRDRGIGPITHWVDDHAFLRILCAYLSQYNQERKEWRQRIIAQGGQKRRGGRLWFGGDELSDGRLDEFVEDMACIIQNLSQSSPRSAEDAAFSYAMVDIDRISEILGITWQVEKDIPFAYIFIFTGFLWNLLTRTVSLPDAKIAKYLAAIEVWTSAPGNTPHTLLEVQQLYGKLLHASLVVPAGRARLTCLERMLGLFGTSPFMPRTPPRGTSDDLRWWAETLKCPDLSRPIPGPVEVFHVDAFSDASSGVGVAIVIGSFWRAWRLLPGWKADERDIGWAEAVGFEFLVRTLCRVPPARKHLKVYGDNKGVVEGWWNGRSRNRQVNGVFKRIHNFLTPSDIAIYSRYIESARNPADDPSRGIYSSRSLLLPPIPIPEALQSFIIDFDQPLTMGEIAAEQLSGRQHPITKPPADPSFDRGAANRQLDKSDDEVLWGIAPGYL